MPLTVIRAKGATPAASSAEGSSSSTSTPQGSEEQAPAKVIRRRVHTRPKSKFGCASCKARRVRCDERKPICSACLSRGHVCEFPKQSGQLVAPRPVMLLPATTADPFDSLSIGMPYKSTEIFHHFVIYRTRAIQAVPNKVRNTLSIDINNSSWFRVCLLMAASHTVLLKDGNWGDLVPTWTFHQSKVLPVIKANVSQQSPQSLRWMLGMIMGTMLATQSVGDEYQSAVHLAGLFSTIDAYVKVCGNRQFINTFRRVPLMHLSMLYATKHATGTTAAMTARLRRVWAEASYLYCQMVTEFMRDIWSDSFDDFRRDQADGPMLWWLFDTLSAERQFREQVDDEAEPGQDLAAKLADTQTIPGVKGPNGKSDGEEIAIWRIVAAAYVLMIGSARLPQQLEGGEFPRMTAAYVVANAVEQRWRTSKKPIPPSLHKINLARMDWLSTEEGLDFVKEVCLDIAPGWRSTGRIQSDPYTFEPMRNEGESYVWREPAQDRADQLYASALESLPVVNVFPAERS